MPLGLPRCGHGTPRDAHGMPTGCRRDAHGVPRDATVCSRDSHGMPTGFPRYSQGVAMACPRYPIGGPTGCTCGAKLAHDILHDVRRDAHRMLTGCPRDSQRCSWYVARDALGSPTGVRRDFPWDAHDFPRNIPRYPREYPVWCHRRDLERKSNKACIPNGTSQVHTLWVDCNLSRTLRSSGSAQSTARSGLYCRYNRMAHSGVPALPRNYHHRCGTTNGMNGVSPSSRRYHLFDAHNCS